MLTLLVSIFSIFGKLIETAKYCTTPKSLSLNETIEIFKHESPTQKNVFRSNVNFYIQQLCKLKIPYESIFIDKTWDGDWEKDTSKWTNDCLRTTAIKGFLQQESQDKWYFSIYMFTSIFFLKNVFFLHKPCLLL